MGGAESWFFKVTVEPARAAAIADGFKALLKSVEFKSGTPSWALPNGWKEELSAGSGIRFATLKAPADGESVEISVTHMPTGMDGGDQWVLSNVNRWRGQLKLDEIGVGQLPTESEEVEIADGSKAILIDIEGSSSSGGGMRPPFAPFLSGGGGGGTPPVAGPVPMGPPEQSDEPDEEVPLKFDAPEGWTKSPNVMFAVATYVWPRATVKLDSRFRIPVLKLA